MRPARTLPLLLVMLALASGARAAAGVGLRWDVCVGDGGLPNKNFACNTNAGANQLVATFTLGTNIAQVTGNEIVIDLASASNPLPAWWSFVAIGTCRKTSISVNTVFPATAVLCADWALGQSASGIGAYQIGLPGPNKARLLVALGVPFAANADLVAGQEYFAVNVLINHLNTVGVGACAGCVTPICIVLHSIKVTTPSAVNDRTLTGPSNSTDSDFATWQGGAGIPGGCPGATPTVKRTWSAVKSLYR